MSISWSAGPHHGLVVLDDQHRVALLLQVAERVDQAAVVARVQADRGLVQHVAHADQARADAGGQPHALQFAAAERVGRAVQGQVVDAHVLQEGQPLADFFQQRLGDRTLGRREVQSRKKRTAAVIGSRQMS